MLIEQIFLFEIRGLGPSGRRPTYTPKIGCFYDKTKISEENL